MPQDAFTIYHTAKELNFKLKNARIDKINQPTPDTIIMTVRTNNKNEKLVLSCNAEMSRVTLSNSQKEAPLQAPSFCMLLRKHLSHAQIESVEAVPYERIIKITFSTKNEMRESGTKIIYAEIMGKYSNITLTEEGKILGAIKQSQSFEGIRPIFPGVTYKLPLPQDKVDLSDKEKSIQTLTNFSTGDFASYIFNNFKGLAKSTATEVVFRYFGKHDVFMNDVKTLNIEDFYKHFCDFYELNNYCPNLICEDKVNDFFITDYKSINFSKRKFNDITTLIDFYFENKESNRTFNDKKRKLYDAVKAVEKKTNKKYQIALEKILSCKDMQDNRIYGELIISNLYRIKSGVKEVQLENYYSPNYDLVTIKLDPNLSPKENAERYFKRYNKEKKTLSAVEPQVKELENQLKYIKSLYDEIDLCTDVKDFIEIEEEFIEAGLIKAPKRNDKKREEKSSFRNYQFDGYDILVGRNNVQNTKLVAQADKLDMWLHTKDYHSCHVIIKSNGSPIPDNVLLFAAEICAYYSKANKSTKVPVNYTLRKFVKRPSGLPLGMVYYTDNKTILVEPNNHLEYLQWKLNKKKQQINSAVFLYLNSA